jgi:putative FmdB family regulatory protein
MPFYEYECQACKYYAEVMQKISDAPLIKCPSCGKRALKKLVSAPVFRLKGGGWYETDFKSDKEVKRNLVGAEKEESKPETKPDAKDAKDSKESKDSKDSKESKPEAKEAKEAKDAKTSGEGKAAEPRASRGAAKHGRVSVPAKAARSARSSAKKARKRRR